MRLHLRALYTSDAFGRLVAASVPAASPAPRFFLGRTPDGPVVAVRHDVPEGIAEQLMALTVDVAAGLDVGAPLPVQEPVSALLSGHQPVTKTWAGPNYRCPPALPREPEVVAVTPANASILSPYLEAWLEDVVDGVPMAAVLREGRAVSVCCSVRTSDEADEAGVETHPNFRGEGHALRAVAAWSHAVTDVNRVPLYSTSWENRPSQRVATKLGLVQYGSVFHVT